MTKNTQKKSEDAEKVLYLQNLIKDFMDYYCDHFSRRDKDDIDQALQDYIAPLFKKLRPTPSDGHEKKSKKILKQTALNANQIHKRLFFAYFFSDFEALFKKNIHLFQRWYFNRDNFQSQITRQIADEGADIFQLTKILSRLDREEIAFFIADSLIQDKYRDFVAFLYGFENLQIREYAPQASALNPLIPASQREAVIKNHGLFTGDIVYLGRKQAYFLKAGEPDFTKAVTLDHYPDKKGIFQICGYMRKAGDHFTIKTNFGDDAPSFLQKQIKTLKNYARYGSLLALNQLPPFTKREGLQGHWDDYALNPAKGDDAQIKSIDDLPSSLKNANEPFLKAILSHLLLDDRRALDPLNANELSQVLLSATAQERIDFFFSYFMEPEAKALQSNFDEKQAQAFQEQFISLLGPILQKPERLSQMRQLAQQVSSMDAESLSFFAADPALSEFVAEKIKAYLTASGHIPSYSYQAFYKEDPRLSLINPLIPLKIRDRLVKDIMVEHSDVKILECHDKDGQKTLSLQRMVNEEIVEVAYEMMPEKLYPGDRLLLTIIRHEQNEKTRYVAPLNQDDSIYKKYLPHLLNDRPAYKKIFSKTVAERRFSLFDQADEALERYQKEADKMAFKGTLKILDPQHLIAQTMQHKRSIQQDVLENQLKDDLGYILPAEISEQEREELTSRCLNSAPSLIAVYDANKKAQHYYWIARDSFKSLPEQAAELTDKTIKAHQFKEDTQALTSVQSYAHYYSLGLAASPFILQKFETIKEDKKGCVTFTGTEDNHFADYYAMTRLAVDGILKLYSNQRGSFNQMSTQEVLSLSAFQPFAQIIGLKAHAQSDHMDDNGLHYKQENPHSLLLAHHLLNGFKEYFPALPNHKISQSTAFQKKLITFVEKQLKELSHLQETNLIDDHGYWTGFEKQGLQHIIHQTRQALFLDDDKGHKASIRFENLNPADQSGDEEDVLFVMSLEANSDAAQTAQILEHFNKKGLHAEIQETISGEKEITVRRSKALKNKP